MGSFDKNASTITVLASLGMFLLTIVILSIVGKTPDGQMQLLIGGAIGIGGAVAGFLKHNEPPPPGTNQIIHTATPPEPTALPPVGVDR